MIMLNINNNILLIHRVTSGFLLFLYNRVHMHSEKYSVGSQRRFLGIIHINILDTFLLRIYRIKYSVGCCEFVDWMWIMSTLRLHITPDENNTQDPVQQVAQGF